MPFHFDFRSPYASLPLTSSVVSTEHTPRQSMHALIFRHLISENPNVVYDGLDQDKGHKNIVSHRKGARVSTRINITATGRPSPQRAK